MRIYPSYEGIVLATYNNQGEILDWLERKGIINDKLIEKINTKKGYDLELDYALETDMNATFSFWVDRGVYPSKYMLDDAIHINHEFYIYELYGWDWIPTYDGMEEAIAEGNITALETYIDLFDFELDKKYASVMARELKNKEGNEELMIWLKENGYYIGEEKEL